MRSLELCVGLLLTSVGCGGGGYIQPSLPPPQIRVTILPDKATVPVGTVMPFVAAVSGSPNGSVTWTASAGTIDQFGHYTAPLTIPQGGVAMVTASAAASPSASESAVVTITLGPVTLSITPSSATVKAGLTEQFVANVGGTSNPSVTWSVEDLPGDTADPGLMNGGDYTAPAPILASDSFAITAVSNADPTKTASASVQVIPLENQERQLFPIELGASGVNGDVGDCCSGTLAALVVDQKGTQYILSANHIMGRVGHAAPGEPIVQPGYIDTLCDFTMPNTVARFTFAPPIASSNIDAAIAQVVPGAVDPQGKIIGLGGIANDGSYIAAPPANTTVPAQVGMPVAKSGRTTGLSCGTVVAVEGTISIGFPADCGNPTAASITFQHQVVMDSIARPGDSGSLVVEASTARPVTTVDGLTYDGQFTTGNPASDILAALNAGTGSTLTFVGGGQHAVSCQIPSGSSQSSFPAASTRAESTYIPAKEITRAVEVKRKYEREIMKASSVVGMAIGRSDVNPRRPSFLVFVEGGKASQHIPASLDGIEVRVVRSGQFKAAGGAGTCPGSWRPRRK
jgi:hypothetical protein